MFASVKYIMKDDQFIHIRQYVSATFIYVNNI